MLSIRAADSPDYFLDQVIADYFLRGGEPQGYFLGGAAVALSLPPKVDEDTLRKLFAGYAPDGRSLVRNAGILRRDSERGRRPAWDCTFSAPKSFDVLWASMPDNIHGKRLQRLLEQFHRDSVSYAFSYLELEAGRTRRGKGGNYLESVQLVAAAFEHGSSRANEAKFHTHLLMLNLGLRADGSFGSIHSPLLYKHKMAAGVVYRNRLAYLLSKVLGLIIEHDQSSFRIVGVPQEACDANSTRRKQVVDRMKLLGLTSSKAASFAALDTRPNKRHISRKELFEKTREICKKLGFSSDDASALVHEGQSPVPGYSPSALADVVNSAVHLLSKSEAYFSKHQVTRLVMEQMQGSNVDPDEIMAAINQKLQRGTDIVHLQNVDGVKQFATTDTLRVEAGMLTGMKRLNAARTHGVKPEIVRRIIQARRSFSPEQRKAFLHLVSKGGFKVLTGLPGTGKTYVLEAAKAAWEEAGFDVIGLSLAGRAAVNLQQEAGIRSDTVAHFLRELEQRQYQSLADHAKKFLVKSRAIIPIKRLKLSSQSIVVVDEAGMLATKDFERLRKQVERHGAKLVVVGDDAQLPPIDAGSPFTAAIERFDAVKMIDIRRQENPFDQSAIKNLLANKTGAFLESLIARGKLHVEVNREQARERLLKDWVQNGGRDNPIDHRILVTNNSERQILNRKCQEQRLGVHGKAIKACVSVGEQRLYEGDFVTFTDRNLRLGIENGQVGFISSIEKSRGQSTKVTVTMSDERKVTCDLRGYSGIELAYCSTTHKLQGATVKHNTYILLNEMQGKEMTYTQVTRHVKEAHIYTDRVSAGDNLEHLAKQIGRSERKHLAHDLLDKNLEPTNPDVGRFVAPAKLETVQQLNSQSVELGNSSAVTQPCSAPTTHPIRLKQSATCDRQKLPDELPPIREAPKHRIALKRPQQPVPEVADRRTTPPLAATLASELAKLLPQAFAEAVSEPSIKPLVSAPSVAVLQALENAQRLRTWFQELLSVSEIEYPATPSPVAARKPIRLTKTDLAREVTLDVEPIKPQNAIGIELKLK